MRKRSRKIDRQKLLGKNIQGLRVWYGFTQSEFVALIDPNLSRHWLGRIERGEGVLDAELLPAIAQILDCTPEELVQQDLRSRYV